MEELYGEIVKLFALVLHQIRLYSPNHPMAQAALKNLIARLDEGFTAEESLSIGPADGTLIFNDCSLDNKMNGVNPLVTECRRLEIEVGAPDINHSASDFGVDYDSEGAAESIRFGFTSIKGVGGPASDIVAQVVESPTITKVRAPTTDSTGAGSRPMSTKKGGSWM